MRTEEEIKQTISSIKQFRKAYAVSERDTYKQICDAQDRVLRWVLGEELSSFYFCRKCEYQHEGIKCPLCGNEDTGFMKNVG